MNAVETLFFSLQAYILFSLTRAHGYKTRLSQASSLVFPLCTLCFAFAQPLSDPRCNSPQATRDDRATSLASRYPRAPCLLLHDHRKHHGAPPYPQPPQRHHLCSESIPVSSGAAGQATLTLDHPAQAHLQCHVQGKHTVACPHQASTTFHPRTLATWRPKLCKSWGCSILS